MALTINTNVLSLDVQRNLNSTQSKLNTAISRLSSGLRVNSAKDDAAGLAIADRMTAQVEGLNTAVDNANDGISLAQTAEGALDEVTSNLQRMRELAVQASSSTNTTSDLESMEEEFSQLLQEVNRIATTTTFNGMNVLDGTFSGQIQVGADAGQTVGIAIASAQTKDLGGSMDEGTLTVGTLTAGTLTLTPGGGTAVEITYEDDETADGLVSAINAQSGLTGIAAAVDDDGNIQLTSKSGDTAFTAAYTASTGLSGGTIAAADVAVSDLDISNIAGAAEAIDVLDLAISDIDSSRSTLGAVQNRLDSTVSNLENISENISAAKSAITDADYAEETANMTKAQILQQAGVAMLSQTNQLPQTVLSLLKG